MAALVPDVRAMTAGRLPGCKSLRVSLTPASGWTRPRRIDVIDPPDRLAQMCQDGWKSTGELDGASLVLPAHGRIDISSATVPP